MAKRQNTPTAAVRDVPAAPKAEVIGGKRYKTRSVVSQDWVHEPTLEGRIIERGKLGKEHDEREFLVVDTGEAKRRVFRTAALEELFEVGEVGDMCRITYAGTKELKGGRRFKRFECACWSEGS